MTTNPETLCRTCVTAIGWIDSPTGGWWAHETHPADDHDAVPGAWVDGDELMEAIAAEVWEHCAGEGTSLVVDDPRNIAGTAAAVARRMLAAPVSSAVPDHTLRDRVVAAIKTSRFDELRTVDHSPNGPLQITIRVDELADTILRALPAVVSSPPATDRATVLREAIDVAREEGHRLEAEQGIEAARGARSVAYLLRKLLVKADMPVDWAVVAYRSPGTRALYCVICARQETGWQPLTADALPDGNTACDFCGGRVLAVASRTLGDVVARYVPAVGARQPDTETQDACACGSAGDAFVPAGHYRDCPQAARSDVGTEFVRQADQPDHEAMARVEAELEQSGVDTPGCDCGHDGMGVRWHDTACEWRSTPPCDHCGRRGHSFEDCPRAERAAGGAGGVADETGKGAPCSQPNPCEDGGDPCDRHEREQSHAENDHSLCNRRDCEVLRQS